MLTAWRGKGNGASLGFGARVAGLASAITSAEWLRGNSAGQWHSNDTEADNAPRVVFVSGIKFHPPRFWESAPQPERLRSHAQGDQSGREVYRVGADVTVTTEGTKIKEEEAETKESEKTESSEEVVLEVQWETFGNFDSQTLERTDSLETSGDEDDST